MTNPKGLSYHANAIGPEFEARLLHFIQSNKWSGALSRETQHYGFEYPYNVHVKTADQLKETEPMPAIFEELLDLLVEQKIIDPEERKCDQAIVNKYKPGEGMYI